MYLCKGQIYCDKQRGDGYKEGVIMGGGLWDISQYVCVIGSGRSGRRDDGRRRDKGADVSVDLDIDVVPREPGGAYLRVWVEMLKARVYSPLCRLWRRGISSIIHLYSFFFPFESRSPLGEALRNCESSIENFGMETLGENRCPDGASAGEYLGVVQRVLSHDVSMKGRLSLSHQHEGILAVFISRTLHQRVPNLLPWKSCLTIFETRG